MWLTGKATIEVEPNEQNAETEMCPREDAFKTYEQSDMEYLPRSWLSAWNHLL